MTQSLGRLNDTSRGHASIVVGFSNGLGSIPRLFWKQTSNNVIECLFRSVNKVLTARTVQEEI